MTKSRMIWKERERERKERVGIISSESSAAVSWCLFARGNSRGEYYIDRFVFHLYRVFSRLVRRFPRQNGLAYKRFLRLLPTSKENGKERFHRFSFPLFFSPLTHSYYILCSSFSLQLAFIIVRLLPSLLSNSASAPSRFLLRPIIIYRNINRTDIRWIFYTFS